MDRFRVVELTKTCDSCPSQWEGETDDGEYVYIRYRWGVLRAEVNSCVIASIVVGDPLDGSMDDEKMQRALEHVMVLTLMR